MIIHKNGQTSWSNQHNTFSQPINDLYDLANDPALSDLDAYNDCTTSIQALIQEAIDKNIPLKGLGAGWSFSKVATSTGNLLNTLPLNKYFSINPTSVVPAYTGDTTNLFMAQCGMGIWELNDQLRRKNRSLKTMGASNGQTIVGAMSTGAHGAAFDFGAVQDYVVGLHIITGPDTHIWLEPASKPVVADVFLQKIKATPVRDDAMFAAALVSFGAMGFIHGVMIETEPLFLLEAYRRRPVYNDDLRTLMQTLDFTKYAGLPNGTERPFHFQVILNPYDLDNGAYMTVMYKRPYQPGYQPPPLQSSKLGPGDDAPVIIGKLTTALPVITHLIVSKLVANNLFLYEKQMSTLGEMFCNTDLHGKVLSAAIGVSIEDVPRTIDLLLAVNKSDGPFAGLFAFRFVKKSKASMAFTKFDFTCVVELDTVFSQDSYNFYDVVWKAMKAANIAFTFHWGKVNAMEVPDLTRMYGADYQGFLDARNKLLTPEVRQVFQNDVLKGWGM